MKKKILKYTLLVIVITLTGFIIYVVLEDKKREQQRTEYPYSEISIKDNLYYRQNELFTGMTYFFGKNSDSTSLKITDGKLTGRVTYLNGKKNGIEEDYDDDGILWNRTEYKEDKKDGIEEYYENGILITKTTFKDDKRNGISEFYKDGKLYTRFMYKDDKRDGIQEYYEDGKLRSTSKYKDDVDLENISNGNPNGQSSGGVFTYETGYRRMKITITPEKWFGWLEDGSGDGNYSGKTIINGKMNGSDLYDENGIEKRGYVSGSTIYYNDPLGEIKLSRR
jgi:antitoxin component YwqK of YwqJK toxin-antitoxin module